MIKKRPIDANQLYDLIENIDYTKYDTISSYGAYKAVRDVLSDILKLIEVAPTIETNSRKQGYWIEHSYAKTHEEIDYELPTECSVCGYRHGLLIPKGFCPKCGSEMKKEIKE